MKVYYVDSSAWLKRYFEEPGSEWIGVLFDSEAILSCARLGYVEVVSALSRRKQQHGLSPEIYGQKSLEVQLDWASFIAVQLTNDIWDNAVSAAATLSLRGADAVHFAAAEELHDRLLFDANAEMVFVCSDQELIVAARQMDWTVIDPANSSSSVADIDG